MVRLLAVTLFLTTMIIASDCQAQLMGNGWIRNRQMRTATPDNALSHTSAEYSFGQASANSFDQTSTQVFDQTSTQVFDQESTQVFDQESTQVFDQESTQAFDQVSEYSVAAPTTFAPATSMHSNSAGQGFRFPAQAYYSSGQSRFSRLIDGPMTHKYRNPAEVDSRYTGGFHQSHFEGIGLPSGDIGLRGNALNWRTW